MLPVNVQFCRVKFPPLIAPPLPVAVLVSKAESVIALAASEPAMAPPLLALLCSNSESEMTMGESV